MIGLLILCLSLRFTIASERTEVVILLFRHGDRSPLHPFPGYTHTSEWAQGNAQLTTIGMQQQYQLGEFIRQRYIPTLVSSEYRRNEIYVRSTDFDRTIMSVLSQLSAVFPPYADQIWNPSLAWQPIPVHVVPQRLDNALLNGKNCPKYQELINEVPNSLKYLEMRKMYGKLLETISMDTNSHVPLSKMNIEEYIDTIVCDKNHNLSLPNWASENLDDLLKIQDFILSLYHDSREKILLSAGRFLSEFWSRVDEKLNGSSNVKAYFYSAHDTTLMSVLNAFGIWNGFLPPYATVLITELIHEEDGWFILFLYRNTSDNSLHQLVVPNCTAMCPVEKLRQLTADITIGKLEWEVKCGLTSSVIYSTQPNFTLALQLTFICILITTLFVMIISVISCRKKPRSQPVQYSKFAIDETDESDTAMESDS